LLVCFPDATFFVLNARFSLAKLILCKQNVYTFPVWYYKLVGKTAKSAKRCNKNKIKKKQNFKNFSKSSKF